MDADEANIRWSRAWDTLMRYIDHTTNGRYRDSAGMGPDNSPHFDKVHQASNAIDDLYVEPEPKIEVSEVMRGAMRKAFAKMPWVFGGVHISPPDWSDEELNGIVRAIESARRNEAHGVVVKEARGGVWYTLHGRKGDDENHPYPHRRKDDPIGGRHNREHQRRHSP